MARMQVEPNVVKYIQGSIAVGCTFTIAGVMDNTGHTAEQVRAVMRRLIEQRKMDVEVVSRGHVWRLKSLDAPEAVESKSMGLFEHVGTMTDGTLIVRDENQKLYRLEEM
jgi:ribulose 1,5-bisphosphate synthetase/thiazole synthase